MHIKGTNVFQLDRWKGRLIDKASLIEAVRSNLATVLLALCFLVGMVSGALITRNVDVSILDKVDFLFYSNFQERASQPVFSVFSASFASSFLFVLACFFAAFRCGGCLPFQRFCSFGGLVWA